MEIAYEVVGCILVISSFAFAVCALGGIVWMTAGCPEINWESLWVNVCKQKGRFTKL